MDFMRQKRKGHLIIIALTLLCIVMYGYVVVLGFRNRDPNAVITYFGVDYPVNTIQGLLQQLINMTCIIITCVDCISGRNISFVIVGITLVMTGVRMLATGNIQPLPGEISGSITIVIIFLVAGLFRDARRKSFTDYTTGLLNQRGFLYALDTKIHEKKMCSIIYYQLSNFRAINDDYGHEVGDIVLKVVADRFRQTVGENGNISRIGGAVFAVLVPANTDPEELAERIISSVSKRIDIVFGDVNLGFYLESNAGISSFPADGHDRNNLVRCADVALIYATEAGANTYDVFDEDMSSRMLHDKEIERMIKESLDKKYFYMVYQPQFHVDGKRLRGFEALIRMKRHDGIVISPGEFIPIAEKSNLIYSIDEFAFDYVISEFAGKIPDDSNLKVSVNISANGMASEDTVSKVIEIINKYKFNPKHLEIEITEYSLAESQEQTIKNIAKLREYGITVALDDFGTGYTSLAHLMKLSAGVLKVDKSLVDDIEKGEVNRDFIGSIGSMGHLLNCEVILEGVENEKQLEYVKELDCDIVQGYVWGKPMSLEEALKLL